MAGIIAEVLNILNNAVFINTIVLILLGIYGLALLFIFFYSLAQLHLVVNYLKSRKNTQNNAAQPGQLRDYPFVTVQLPVYNEYYVIGRLMQAVAAFDYPRDKFEVQVLDDSTDETKDLIAQKVEALQDQGFQFHQVRRPNRQGFKAGALDYGLQQAKGDYIAIFDADFVPNPDFLKKTIPYFNDPNIGLVQTRWEHLNKDYSLFTRAQAFALDAHFRIEQRGRNYGGFFMNFNGTAGIWRKATIEDAGGWKDDTLTEDLDLSYRAQLNGWRFKYLEEQDSPAELPAEMNSIKSQQYRWTKGAAETAKKLFPAVLKSSASLTHKFHAFFHLFNSSVFICILICALLSVPGIFFKNLDFFPVLFKLASLFLVSLLIVGVAYFIAFRQRFDSTQKALLNFLWMFPLFLCISMGLSLHNARAVLQGFTGKKTSFIRTPKFNLVSLKDKWEGKKYLKSNMHWLSWMEGFFTLYFLAGIGLAFQFNDFGLFPFHVMLAFGFGSIFLYTIWHHLTIRGSFRGQQQKAAA